MWNARGFTYYVELEKMNFVWRKISYSPVDPSSLRNKVHLNNPVKGIKLTVIILLNWSDNIIFDKLLTLPLL